MTKPREPRWLVAARTYIGQKEIAGRRHNPQVLRWWTLIRAPFTDDETPWCAGFVGGVLEQEGIRSSRSAAARSFLNWGEKLRKPIIGCIVVFERGPRNGHVGFYVGKTTGGNILILGGNQGDAVNIKPFAPSRVLGYRWPTGEARVDDADHVEENDEPVSKIEAFASLPDELPDEEEGRPHRPGFFGRVRNWVVGTLTTFGFTGLGAMTDWQIAIVLFGFLLLVATLVFLIALWLFGKKGVRDWIADKVA